MIEPRSDSFVEDYFTTEEQALVARVSTADRPSLLALLWSGKESALKALRTGLRLDTRGVIVSLVDEQLGRDLGSTFRSSSGLDTWHPLQVRHTSGQIFQGWWNHTENLLRTVVATPPPTPPVVLKIRTPLQRRRPTSESTGNRPLGSVRANKLPNLTMPNWRVWRLFIGPTKPSLICSQAHKKALL
jgi:4'-phosphopantetheinyl transferase